ncbi:hypothetical protein I6A84_04585, partial [Frankia sp. CNm7]|nr:hypothetical protein [Frankia nepalensis]
MVNTVPEPAALSFGAEPAALPPAARLQAPVPFDLQAAVLRDGYRSGRLRVVDVVEAVLAAIAARGDDGVWIHVAPRRRRGRPGGPPG